MTTCPRCQAVLSSYALRCPACGLAQAGNGPVLTLLVASLTLQFLFGVGQLWLMMTVLARLTP